MSEIEDALRRRILDERAADGTRTEGPPVAPHSLPDEPLPHYAAKPAHEQSFLERKQQKGGLVGAIAALLLLLAKIGAPLLAILVKFKVLLVALKLGKIGLTFGSMLLSAGAYSALYGWKFGTGIVLLIFVHECGHVLGAKLRGVPTTGMMFIPFFGAYVTTKRVHRSAAENAFIAIMGPAVGGLGAALCIAGWASGGGAFWLALAQWGLLINLINLAPVPPLDGGHIVWPLFSKENGYAMSMPQKWTYGAAYVGLALLLLAGVLALQGMAHAPRAGFI